MKSENDTEYNDAMEKKENTENICTDSITFLKPIVIMLWLYLLHSSKIILLNRHLALTYTTRHRKKGHYHFI